jgi:hypothetical protein
MTINETVLNRPSVAHILQTFNYVSSIHKGNGDMELFAHQESVPLNDL